MINDTLPGAPRINKRYIVDVYLFTVLLPFIAICVEAIRSDGRILATVIEKWFLFFAIGMRFLLGGIRRTARIKFRTGKIFHIEKRKCCPVLRELGITNFSFGTVAVISFFIPSWRNITAFGSCLYYGAAAFSELLIKQAGMNHVFMLFSNVCIFLILLLLLL